MLESGYQNHDLNDSRIDVFLEKCKRYGSSKGPLGDDVTTRILSIASAAFFSIASGIYMDTKVVHSIGKALNIDEGVGSSYIVGIVLYYLIWYFTMFRGKKRFGLSDHFMVICGCYFALIPFVIFVAILTFV